MELFDRGTQDSILVSTLFIIFKYIVLKHRPANESQPITYFYIKQEIIGEFIREGTERSRTKVNDVEK